MASFIRYTTKFVFFSSRVAFQSRADLYYKEATKTSGKYDGKKAAKSKNSRRWTEIELNCFANVLADSENSFASTLDKLALKKSSNNEVNMNVKNIARRVEHS